MMKQKTSPLRAVAFLALLAGACTMILPFVWMLSTSRLHHPPAVDPEPG